MRKPVVNPKRQLININPFDIGRLLLALLFLCGIFYFVTTLNIGTGMHALFLIMAAIVGGYMAMNIGANDSANNVGPAVGAGALTLGAAIIVEVIFEFAGAMIAGGDVVKTIKKGIIDPSMIKDVDTFIWVMMAALLAAATWVNTATFIGAPVSTTHSIVGGVAGAGIAAGGLGIVDWFQMQKIVASWVISPVMGGLIAASFLYAIKRTIFYKKDLKQAGLKMVPVFVAFMGWAFTTYLILKGIKKIIKIDFLPALGFGFIAAILTYLVVKFLINKRADRIDNNRTSIDKLFAIPLACGAALLAFAHGSNDVANAIGPLAAIYEAVRAGEIATKVHIPIWIMLVGSLGIVVGLALFGPKLIKTVGQEITELDMARGFCVALAAAITVIIASHYGIPVSSTHIAVGGIFGVGFLREHLQSNYNKNIDKIRRHMADEEKNEQDISDFIERFEAASMEEKKQFLRELKSKAKKEEFSWAQRRRFKKAYKAKLIERSMLFKILAAWIFTVPIAGTLSAAYFFMLRGMFLP